MKNSYLTVFFTVLIVCCTATVAWTLHVDAHGIFRNNSDKQLSRLDQFRFMRNTKPLRLLRSNAELVTVGSSRSARLSTASAGVENGFNAAIPGATPQEQAAMLSLVASLDTSRVAIIGLDFDAFLSFHPGVRRGFREDLVQPVQRPAHHQARLVALKHVYLSTSALRNSYLAVHGEDDATSAVYRHDGSWNRPKPVYKSGDFRKLSRQKLENYAREQPLLLAMGPYRRMLATCHEAEKLDCQFLLTPIHLFHLGILEQAGAIDLWREWHYRLVEINRDVAQAYGQAPLPLWGFNDYAPAVGQKLSSRRKQADPWFLDNVHFRPRFGDLMLQRILVLDPAAGTDAGTLLDEASVEAYLADVYALDREFREREARVIGKLFELLGLP